MIKDIIAISIPVVALILAMAFTFAIGRFYAKRQPIEADLAKFCADDTRSKFSSKAFTWAKKHFGRQMPHITKSMYRGEYETTLNIAWPHEPNELRLECARILISMFEQHGYTVTDSDMDSNETWTFTVSWKTPNMKKDKQ